MMSVYNAQYEDYKVVAATPDLSEDQKDILRKKKVILTEVDPMISLYTGYAESGVLPAVELETQIINLLNRLLAGG